MIKRALAIIAVSELVVSSIPVSAHAVPASKFLETSKPYAPYEFLIGDWYTRLPQENAVIHQQFGWGPGKASMTYATLIQVPGRPEHLHFGGMMMFNPATKAIDFLFAVEPGSGVEERGTFAVQADGSVIREVEVISPSGKGERARQVFRRNDDGSVTMELFNQTAKGFVSALTGGPMVMTKELPK